jgi:hypothetical protein
MLLWLQRLWLQRFRGVPLERLPPTELQRVWDNAMRQFLAVLVLRRLFLGLFDQGICRSQSHKAGR